LNILEKLKMKETDASKMLEDRSFDILFKNMFASRMTRIFFLSSLGNIMKSEEIPLIVDAIRRILIGERIQTSKAEKLARIISDDISKRISERRAVSARVGTFGIIDPFDEEKHELKDVDLSINHIYVSYFTNYFAVLANLKDYHPSVRHKSVSKMFETFDENIGKFIEEFFACEKCNKISRLNKYCNHSKVHLRLFKLNTAIRDAWEKGLILPGYVAYALRKSGWKSCPERNIYSTNGCIHQVDAIAERKTRIAIIECKNYAPDYAVPKDEVMKALGIMDDLESYIQTNISSNAEIRKMIITTSGFRKEIKGINKRKDILLLEKDDILGEPNKWVGKIG